MRPDIGPPHRFLGLLSAALLCVAAVPIATYGADPPIAATERYLLFMEPGDQVPAGILPLATYDGALLVSITAAEARALAGQGVHMRPLAEPTWIQVPGYRFDTREGEPDLPPELRAKATQERAPYIVQFVGPIHPDWKQAVTGTGGTFARYGNVNSNGWVVLMSREARDAVFRLPFVNWVGAYHPAYKISEPLAEYPGTETEPAASEPASVLLQVFAPEQLEQAAEKLAALGGTILSSGPADPESPIQPFVIAEVPRSAIPAAAALHEVAWIQLRPRFEPLVEQASHSIQTGACGLACTSRTPDDVPWWRDGVTGAGPAPSCSATLGTEQLVGVLDSGIEPHPDFESCPGPGCTVFGVTSQLEAGGGSCGNPQPAGGCFDPDGHGTAVAGVIAGSAAASGGELPVESCTGKGLAFGARLDVEICGGNLDCLNVCDPMFTIDSFFRRTYDRGSRMSNHSWGASVVGAYDAFSQAFDTLAWDNNGSDPGRPQDYLWLIAAGNDGPASGTIGSPATAKDGVSVAALYNGLDGSCYTCDGGNCADCDRVVCYSSRGPSDDGRHGPHVAGLSQCINAPEPFGGYTTCFNGTSAATPTVTAAAAQIRDWFIHQQGEANPSGSLIKATLLNSGEPVQIPATTVPDHHVGWGRVKLDNIWDSTNPDLNALWLDDTVGLATGGLTEFAFTVRSGALPLRVMLVWMDYPGAVGTGGLVNDLDLLVREPGDAACYRGNDATGNESNPVACAAPGTFDNLNNDEGVRVSAPVSGIWTVEVSGANVPQADQPFALVVTGDVTRCASPPPPPPGIVATATGPNAVTVSWDAVAGDAGYAVYRSDGACPGGQFERIGTALPQQTSFTDTDVSGGSTYSYVVRTLDDEGCVSVESACADVVATGVCALPPSFAGLQSVVDNQTSSCSVDLSWDPATTNCPTFPSLTYNVYRSTEPTFEPGAATLLESCVEGTSYTDSNVSDGLTYHYIVRAEDTRSSGGNGACHGGNQESNVVLQSGTPTGGQYSPGTFHDDGGDFGPRLMIAEDPWYVTSLKNNTPGGSHSYRAGDWVEPACAALETPLLRLDPAASSTLTYWTAWDIHWYNDVGVVEVSTDRGNTWIRLTPTPSYPSTGGTYTCVGGDVAGYANSDSGVPNPNFTQYTIDLFPYQGQDVIVRFLYATDDQWTAEGWWLDDITITGVLFPVACTNDAPECTDGPAFDGARTVNSDELATCSLTVSWDPAQARCAASPGVTYSVYRDTDPTFVPDAANRVATCVTGSSWNDTDIFFGETYYYVVQAEDSTANGSGPCNGGNVDGNVHRVGGIPGGPTVVGTWKVDGGDLEPQQMLVPEDWRITNLHNNTPGVSQGYSYWASDRIPYPGYMCSSLTSPPIQLGAGSVLSFHSYEALDYYLFGADGGFVEVSTDDGRTWERINDGTSSTGAGYDFCNGGGGPFPMYSNWIPRWEQRQIEFPSILDNRRIQLRFRFVSDEWGGLSNLYEGWLLDDIEIANILKPTTCQNPNPACDVPPVFRGATGAVNDEAVGTCSVTVSWDPAEVTCGAYAENTYTIYRSTDPAFVPGPETMIETCVGGTSYVDTGVGYGQPYYYIVRAEDSRTGGSGPCNGGTQDDNSRTAWVFPTGPAATLGTWLDDAGDTYAPQMMIPPEWSISTYNNHTQYGGTSYQSVAEGSTSYEGGVCASITSPPLTLGTDSVLSFWAWPRMDVSWVDAGIIEVSNDGGATWTKVTPYQPGGWNNYPITTPGGGNDCIGAYERAFGGYDLFPDNWTQWFVPLGGYHPPWAPGTFPLFPGYSDQTIQIRFRFGSGGLPIPSGREGWFIDDIQVTNVWLPAGCQNSAADCADTPVFRGVSDVGTGTDPCTLTVGWNPAVAGCVSEPTVTYSLYKSRDPGFVPGPDNLLTTCLAGAPFVDDDVSYDITEYYVARAEDSHIGGAGTCNGGIEDGNVFRVAGTPRGPADGLCLNGRPTCSDPPVFAGAQGVVNDGTATCSATLTWDPAPSRCLDGTAITYSVYRSTTRGVAPSWQNRIASCVSGTTYTDTTAFGGGTHHYVVRAEDTTANGAGACNSGNEDPNVIEVSVTPSGPMATLFSDGFEAGLGNWTATDWWLLTADDAGSGLQSVFSPAGAEFCEALTLNDAIYLPEQDANAFLSIWTRIEAADTGPWNVGVVEISVDGGSWTRLDPIGGYPDVSQPAFDACTGYGPGFGGNPQIWQLYDFNLSAYMGSWVRIRFLNAARSGVFSDRSWYVDEVEIRSGSQCSTFCPSPPASPLSVSATATGPETVTVSWGAVSRAVLYDVYRGAGDCAAAGFEKIATVAAPATSYEDAEAGGGGLWSYHVVAEDAANCRSGPSACDGASVTGQCTVAPTFAGLRAVDATGEDLCGVHLSWDEARENCPTGTGVSYSVHRGTAPGFAPGPETLLARCVQGTSFQDHTVDPGDSYFYVVRAEDSMHGGAGPCNGGNQDANTVELAGRTNGALVPGTFFDSAGDGSTQRMILESPWRLSPDKSFSGGASYHSGQSTTVCAALTTPVLQLDVAAPSELSFWSSYNTLDEGRSAGMVEISDDGGLTWFLLSVTPGYTDENWGLEVACLPPEESFSGYATDWTRHTASLLGYLGRDVMIRFVYGTQDPEDLREGWYIDDIQVTSVLEEDTCRNPAPACAAEPFFDGVAGVDDAGTDPCGVVVSWEPARSACSQYPEVVYNVYRGTDRDFVPAPSNLVATCLTTTSYTDPNVSYETKYYYVVRAEDRRPGGGNGACGVGLEEANIARLGAEPTAMPPVLGTWLDDAGDTQAVKMVTNPLWHVSTDDAHSGVASYFAPQGIDRCDNLLTPPLVLGEGSELTFWSRIEVTYGTFADAAGVVEVSGDAGATWQRVTPIEGYPDHYFSNILCGIYFDDCFTRIHPWAPYTVDLSAFANQTVRVRFHFASHYFGVDPTIGWHVDDIAVTNVFMPASCVTQSGCSLAVDVEPDTPPPACSGTDVTFSAGVSGGVSPLTYQWTEDGIDIPGANASSYAASRTDTAVHTYNCKVTDGSGSCGDVLDPVGATGQWTDACAPDVVYDTTLDPVATLAQVCGDGDAFVEPGERWSAYARLINAGSSNAGQVRAGLAANLASAVDANVVSGAAIFGEIGPGMNAMNFADRFEFCAAEAAACGGAGISFDVTDIDWEGGGSPPNAHASAFEVPVGVDDPGADAWFDLTPVDPIVASVGSAVSDLVPVTIASPDTAVLSYGFGYSPPREIIYESEFAAIDDWSRSGGAWIDAAIPDTCPGSAGGTAAYLPPGSNIQQLFPHTHSELRLEFDHESDASLDPGEFLWAEYMYGATVGSDWIPMFQGPDGGDGVWHCDKTFDVPDPSTWVRFRFWNNANAVGENARIDSFRLTGLTSDTWTDAVRVELQDTSGTWHILKEYGVPDAAPYDLLALGFYTGPGTYRIRLSENAGGTATLTTAGAGEGLHVTRNPVTECDVSPCCGTTVGPPPVGDGWLAGGEQVNMSRSGNTVTYSYDTQACSSARAVVVYGNVGDYSTYVGVADCDGDGTFDATGLDDVWFNVIWVNAGNEAGHPGYSATGARTHQAAGIGCGIVADKHGDGRCE